MYVREVHSEALPLAAWNYVFKDFEGSFKVLVWSLCFTAGLSLVDTMTTATRTLEMMHRFEACHTDLRLSIGIDIPRLSIVFSFSPRSLVFLRGLILLIFSYFQLKFCINREASIVPDSALVLASVCASIFG